MALVACSECGKQISDRAATCLHCGNPIAPPSTQPIPVSLGGEVVTTQQTGKIWKAWEIVGVLMVILGIGACVSGSVNPFSGIVFAVGGAIAFLVGRFGGWWSHG